MSELHLERIPGTGIGPERWDSFIQNSPQGAVWMLHGYASIIAPGWEAWIVSRKGEWRAVLPFLPDHRYGIARSLQPKFAQYWGPCFLAPSSGTYHDLSEKKAILDLIIPNLRSFRHILWYCSPAMDYWLPFLWAGFSLSPRISYVLDLTLDEPELIRNTSSTFRRYLKKGASLSLDRDSTPVELLDLLRRQQQAGHEIIGRSDNNWRRIEELMSYLLREKLGWVHTVRNSSGTIEAGAMFVTFHDRAIYLLGTYDPEEGKRAAMPVLMWQSILHFRREGLRVFDFEGSMIPGVERFFRRAGGRPLTYLQLERNHLPLPIRWINALRS